MRLERWHETVATHEGFAGLTGRYLDSRDGSSTATTSTFSSPALDKALPYPMDVLGDASVTSAPGCHANAHGGVIMDGTGGLHLNQALWHAMGVTNPGAGWGTGATADVFDGLGEMDGNFFFDGTGGHDPVILGGMYGTPPM